jgi:hypothetical protein
LKEYDEVDCLDFQNKKWYTSTVVTVNEAEEHGRTYQRCQIGYRTYSETGVKVDAHGRYDGFEDKYNHWVSLTSPRISKPYTQAKAAKETKGYKPYVEVFDDENDPEHVEGEAPVWAVLRPKKSKSALLIRLVNLLGEIGGFDKMLAMIVDNKENDPVTFDLVGAYLEILGKVYPYLHRDFAAEYIPKVLSVV